MIPKFLLKEAIVAPPGFNRWRVPPASIAIHLCIGSVYAWSLLSGALTKESGVVAQAADDWTLKSVTIIFSVAIVFLGLCAAVAGKWLEKVGPRCVGVTAAFCWGGGLLIGALGVKTHQLWLLYLGYGVLGGCGLGLGYVSPVSTLIRWFPDRRGLATGMAIMGFGGGAMIAKPIKDGLLSAFSKAPESLGTVAELGAQLTTEAGRRFVDGTEVVIAKASEAAGGAETAYAIGTGNTGAFMTFLTLGIVYFLVMIIASFSYRVPAEGWKPEGWSPPTTDSKKASMVTQNHVHIDQVLKTPQFYLLWIVLCFNVTAGIGVIGVAKTMMNEIFGSLAIVTLGFAGTYVLMISIFNMLGRIFWASTSDKIGRKNTYHCFFILGPLLYLCIPFFARSGAGSDSTTWLWLFYGATMVIFTMYGGGFATIPAYLADIFGTKFVGGIHGRLLTAWSTAGVLGPLVITSLRQKSLTHAIKDLTAKVDPAKFEATFGAPVAQLGELVQAKTVTVAALLDIAPSGTIDPTPNLYNSTMYVMAALLIIAFFANLAVKPVEEKHHMKEI